MWVSANCHYLLLYNKMRSKIVIIVSGIILTSQLWGFLSDTYGRRKVLIFAALAAFVTSVLSAMSVNFLNLVIVRFLNGCFIAGSTGTIYAYMGEFIDSKSRSNSIMISSTIYGVGCISLPFMALWLINGEWRFDMPFLPFIFKPWRLFVLICAVPSLISGIFACFLPESPKFTYHCLKDVPRTMKILRKIQRINKGSDDLEFKLMPIGETTGGSEERSVLRKMFEQVLELISKYPRSFGIVALIQFGTYFVCNGMLVFFPDILNQTASFVKGSGGSSINADKICDIVEATIANKTAASTDAVERICVEKFEISVYWFVIYLETCYTLGFFVISALLWLKVHRLYVLNFIYITTGVAGIAIVMINDVTASSFLYVWLLTCGLTITLMNAIAIELFPTHLRSLAMSLFSMIGRLGECRNFDTSP